MLNNSYIYFGQKELQMSRVFAYCRVSTADQTTDNQIQEIAAAGFTVQKGRVIAETVSGSVPAMERKGFLTLLNKLEAADVLIVTKLDRLGRNAMDVRASVERLASTGVRVHCLALGGVDLTSPAGKMTMGVIAAVAEFERDLLVERTQSGLSRAKAQGKVLGRPRSVDAQASKLVLERLERGEAVATLAREFGTSRQSIMRIRQSANAIESSTT
jgi:putative DNA-invertase from lambdoid prophage Rac